MTKKDIELQREIFIKNIQLFEEASKGIYSVNYQLTYYSDNLSIQEKKDLLTISIGFSDAQFTARQKLIDKFDELIKKIQNNV